jgi:flagellar hook-associated protein 3 FlgL
MTRVASIPMQRTLFDAIGRSQAKLAEGQLQLATQKKAQNYADLGTEAVRTLSARSLLARQDAHATVAKRLETTMEVQGANISNLETSAETLRVALLQAIGTNEPAGLPEAIEAAFQQARASLNAEEAGVPLFSGSRTDQIPFTASKLDDLKDPATVAGQFVNDTVQASARVSEGLDVQFGVLASDLGTKVMDAFKSLADLGPIGKPMSSAQSSALSGVIKQLEGGLGDIRSINAENGRKQAQIETLSTRADDRAILLKDLIGRSEDADMAQIASDLTIRRTALEASYSVFSQLSSLSLVRFLT